MRWFRHLRQHIRARPFLLALGSLLDLSGNTTRRALSDPMGHDWRPARTAAEGFARDRAAIEADLHAAIVKMDLPATEAAAMRAMFKTELDRIYSTVANINLLAATS